MSYADGGSRRYVARLSLFADDRNYQVLLVLGPPMTSTSPNNKFISLCGGLRVTAMTLVNGGET